MLQRFARFLGQQFKLLLLLLLAASFVFWGVADMVMQRPSRQELAKAGSETITDTDFRAMYDRTREQYRRSPMAKGLTDEDLMKMGLPRQVLDGLINDRLLMIEAAEEGLYVSEKSIADITKKNATFAGEDGTFDRKRFEQVIHSMGMTEKSYVSAMRTNEASQQLGFALFGQKLLHPMLFQAMHLLRKELRDAQVWIFTQSLKPAALVPTEAQLRDFLKMHEVDFQAPEYRTIGLIYFDPKKTGAEVNEAALHAAYEEQKASMARPESREVDQLLFNDKESADAAYRMIRSGASWEKAAKDPGIFNKGVTDLGRLTQDKTVPALRQTIFTAKVNEANMPVQSSFGWHLLRVRAIHPMEIPSYEEAKPTLDKKLQQQQSEDALFRQIDQLESALSSGADFESAAKAADAKIVRVGPVDAAGLKPNGEPQAGLPNLPGLLEKVFALKGQDTTSALTLPDGRSLVAGVTNILPSKPRSFEESRGKLALMWEKDNRAKLIQKMADDIAAMTDGAEDKARAGGAFAASVEGIRRDAKPTLRDPAKNSVALPPEMIESLFTLREGQHTRSFVLDTGDVAFATLNHVHTVPQQLQQDTKDATADLLKTRDALNGEVGGDAYKLYIQYLRTKHKVTVNQARLDALMKPQASQE